MSAPQSAPKLAPPATMPGIPTARERADLIADLADHQLAGLFVGSLVMLEDPNNHKIEIIDRKAMTSEHALRRVDLAQLGKVMLDEKPELVPMIADGMRCAVQAAPDLLQSIRNEVRRNFNKPPMVDAEFLSAPFEGKVTMRNDAQTVLTDAKGLKSVLFANHTLSSVPPLGATVRAERGEAAGQFAISPALAAKPTPGLSR